ncbi:hypothetical protein HNQ34_003031 [Anoxybacillus tepidamans]|uniref:Uncharacterized protein n=1 Tax=Anoxybacteroides tepidamans TaxID=265948 RepID=A0A7W8ISH3_9BACL|nr:MULTISPECIES: hypothetical protein [Bacillaceae]AMQ22062.1 hypothetical protein A0V43_15700 [Geobacillus sp. JS12]EMI10847.1 hypothetical protein F510_0976 [Anoxybacillus gonensis]MBB5325925.1 hypothetical protein [Anoxybacillus tepidamans]MCL6586376.1 hypothetical protein [Anoxybacillus sp.]
MSKEKKFTTEELYDILHKFFQDNKNKNIKKVSFSNIARYAKEELHIQGIEYYHFSRNKEINNRIKEFKKTLKEDIVQYTADNSYFANLNVKEFVKCNINNPDRLIKLLMNIQEMHKKLYDRTVNAELKVRELEKKLADVYSQKEDYKAKYKELKKESELMKQEIKAYKEVLEIKEEGQLIEALNSTGLYLVQKENEDTLDKKHNENIERLDDTNGKNLEKLLEQFEDIFD